MGKWWALTWSRRRLSRWRSRVWHLSTCQEENDGHTHSLVNGQMQNRWYSPHGATSLDRLHCWKDKWCSPWRCGRCGGLQGSRCRLPRPCFQSRDRPPPDNRQDDCHPWSRNLVKSAPWHGSGKPVKDVRTGVPKWTLEEACPVENCVPHIPKSFVISSLECERPCQKSHPVYWYEEIETQIWNVHNTRFQWHLLQWTR